MLYLYLHNAKRAAGYDYGKGAKCYDYTTRCGWHWLILLMHAVGGIYTEMIYTEIPTSETHIHQ